MPSLHVYRKEHGFNKNVKAGIIHMTPASEVIDNCLGRLSNPHVSVCVHKNDY